MKTVRPVGEIGGGSTALLCFRSYFAGNISGVCADTSAISSGASGEDSGAAGSMPGRRMVAIQE